MNCVIFVAHPAPSSLTKNLATTFKQGIVAAGHSATMFDIFHKPFDEANITTLQDLIKTADGIAFAFPWWWEMPPYPMVELLQKVFVNGFAFTHDGNHKKTSLLSLPTQLIICAGQAKTDIQLGNLKMAMDYCGLKPITPLVLSGVGPSLSQAVVNEFHRGALAAGQNFFKDDNK